jgi:hypothetical protein
MWLAHSAIAGTVGPRRDRSCLTDAGGLQRLEPALFTTYSLPEGMGNPNVYPTDADHSGATWRGQLG